MGKKGFSLLEMVLALALGGSVLLASVSLMTTFVELWERETRPDWQTEAQIVAKKFLNHSLQEAYIRLQEMYTDKKGTPTEPKPYWRDSDPQPGTFYLYWQNHSTPPFIDNPQGRFIEYHLVHDRKKHRVQLHYRLLPLDYKQQLPPTQHVTLFRQCTYFGYAYYAFDDDKWNITLEPMEGPSGKREIPEGFYFQFEDKTQLFIYLKKHKRFPFEAPQPSNPAAGSPRSQNSPAKSKNNSQKTPLTPLPPSNSTSAASTHSS